MSESVIKDSIFERRGKIPQNILAQLAIRGDDTHIDDALVRLGWMRELVVVPIVSVEQGSGRIIGSKFAVRGPIAQYELKPTSIWQEASKDITMVLDLDGSNFSFSNRGANLPGELYNLCRESKRG